MQMLSTRPKARCERLLLHRRQRMTRAWGAVMKAALSSRRCQQIRGNDCTANRRALTEQGVHAHHHHVQLRRPTPSCPTRTQTPARSLRPKMQRMCSVQCRISGAFLVSETDKQYHSRHIRERCKVSIPLPQELDHCLRLCPADFGPFKTLGMQLSKNFLKKRID